MENPEDNVPRPPAWRDINWTPLLMVISSAYLISLATYSVIMYSGSFELESKLGFVFSFLASTAFLATIALVIFRREDMGKKSLVVGMLLLLCMIALRTSVYLRA